MRLKLPPKFQSLLPSRRSPPRPWMKMTVKAAPYSLPVIATSSGPVGVSIVRLRCAFFTAVETGDEIALRYAARAASHAADCIIAVSDALQLKPTVQVALSGSIMTAVAPPAYRRMIEYELFRRKGKSFTLRVNDRPPVDGAVRWVRLRNHLVLGF